MAEEYKSIKIKEDVKNRLDRYKKRCSYSDCLDEMLGYFELTGIEPRLGQTPPVATFVSTMKSGNAVLLKRMDDLIKILRNIEINKIDPILHGVEDGFFSDRSNTPEVGLSVSEEELYQVIQMNEKLKSDIRNKDILIQNFGRMLLKIMLFRILYLILKNYYLTEFFLLIKTVSFYCLASIGIN